MNISIRKIPHIILVGISLMSCNMFAGLIFPKIRFSFWPMYAPPSSANERLNAGAEYPQTFTIFFSQAGNSFNAYFVPTIFVNKPYSVLHIKEMKYEWDDNTGIFLKDRSFNLPANNYVARNGWYWLGGIPDFFHVNFEKIFKGKKADDEFLFKLILVYSFDEDHESTQVLEYKVTTLKGKYVSPFMGL